MGNVQPTPLTPQATTTVRPATTTAVTSSSANNNSTFGQMVTFTATVSASDPAANLSALAGESIDFWDGVTMLGVGALNARGVATFTTTLPLTAGVHTITAGYLGDGTDEGSTGVLGGGQSVSRRWPRSRA